MMTGDQVARYTELNYLKPVTDVAYHPRDHILAVCSLGENQPVLVYKYDPFSKWKESTSVKWFVSFKFIGQEVTSILPARICRISSGHPLAQFTNSSCWFIFPYQ